MSVATFQTSQPTVALVYDRVNTTYGGAEKVLLALHRAFPSAPLYTSLADKRAERWSAVFTLKTSWLQRIPFASYIHRLLAALMPLAFESFDLSAFDIVISVASAECKGVLTSPNQLHVCYLLSPPRYVYHQRAEMLAAARWYKIPGLKQLGELALRYLAWWDKAAMSRPDKVYPLSKVVAKRYQTIYGRRADGIFYPPIDSVSQLKGRSSLPTELAAFCQQNTHFSLMVARLVPYKRVDLAITACADINQPLIIIGTGPEKEKLLPLLNPQTLLLDSVDESVLEWLYSHCQMVLVPGQEDFGLTALEANAHGRPVVINHQAGAAELIESKKHGIQMKNQTKSALIQAIMTCQKQVFSRETLRHNAQKYDTSKFVARFQQQVLSDWQTLPRVH